MLIKLQMNPVPPFGESEVSCKAQLLCQFHLKGNTLSGWNPCRVLWARASTLLDNHVANMIYKR